MWHGFISGIQFLSIIPLRSADDFNARAALPFFPLCGLLIGVLLAIVDAMARQLWSLPAAAVLDIVFLAFVSGALHLDGLADTADGIYGQRRPQQALAIMKDSRIGAIGMITVGLCLAAKWSGVHNLPVSRAIWLILVPAYARAAVLFGIRYLPYGRPEGGTGQAFFSPSPAVSDYWGVALIVLLSMTAGWRALLLNAGFVLFVVVLLLYYRRKIGCITGDMLGAMIELIEAGLFLAVSAGSEL